MSWIFNEEEHKKHDRHEWNVLNDNIIKYFILSAYHEIENYDVDCLLYGKKTKEPIVFVELEHADWWKNGKERHWFSLLARKVNKYDTSRYNLKCPCLYLIFNDDYSLCLISIFKYVERNYIEQRRCFNKVIGGYQLDTFFNVPLEKPYMFLVETKDIEEAILRIVLHEIKKSQKGLI